MASSSRTTASSPGASEHWTAPYRRRLGINDSPVVLYTWYPPFAGKLKIVFFVHPKIAKKLHTIIGMAFNPGMELVGLTYGTLEFKSDVGMQLYALRASANLAKSLKNVAPLGVVYHSKHPWISAYLSVEDGRPEYEAILRQSMPDDLEIVDKKCGLVSGNGISVVNTLSGALPFLAGMIESLKMDAGLVHIGEHWAMAYRDVVGIGDSLVLVYKKGSLKRFYKIVFLAVADGGRAQANSTCTAAAIAVTPLFKLIGITGGSMKFQSAMGMQLYALRAAGNLAEKLREKDVHVGHVVYQSGLVEGDDRQGETEFVVDRKFLNDLATVDAKFLNVVGDNTKKLFTQLEKNGTPALKALIDKLKNVGDVRRR